MTVTRQDRKSKLPISAIVVGRDEGKFLGNCLNSIQFCDEILYFDLNSKDDSINIAGSFGAKTARHRLVPIGEVVVSEQVNKVKHDWVLIIDPDEVVDPKLMDYIVDNFHKITSEFEIGSVTVPWTFYFKGRRLKGTPWGGINERLLLADKSKFIFTSTVHSGRKLAPGFNNFEVPFGLGRQIHHYWMQNWPQLIEKHRRYLKLENQARLTKKEEASFSKLIFVAPKQFAYSFIKKKGYLDGVLGLQLSLFWAWYQTSAEFNFFTFNLAMKKTK